MIDPAYFGCSSKLSLNETLQLALLNPSGLKLDLTTTAVPTNAFSIDRVNRCSQDWDVFADIAINHVVADLGVAGVGTSIALVAFEFGPDASTAEEHLKASRAFISALRSRDIEIGKFHSSIGLGPSAVTIAIAGASRGTLAVPAKIGWIYLSRPLGFFKAHYLREMGMTISASYTHELRRPVPLPSLRDGQFRTDISGHGLVGALAATALKFNLNVSVRLTKENAVCDEVLETRVDCLQNLADSYSDLPINLDDFALSLATLRETAGPTLAFVPSKVDDGSLGKLIGDYTTSAAQVSVKWQ